MKRRFNILREKYMGCSENKTILFDFMYFFIVAIYVIFLLLRGTEVTYAEVDSYALPTISLEYRGSILMNSEDLIKAQEDYPNLYANINSYEDLRSGKLIVTPTGQWESYYFPIYPAVCVPVKVVLQILHLNQEWTFGITNTLCMLLFLIVIWSSKKVSQLQKMIALFLIMVSPSFLYVQFISSEMMIFCFVGIGMIKFYEKKYKTAAIWITLAGLSNPTVMAIGIVIIFDYYANILKENKNMQIMQLVKAEVLSSVKLALCFLPSFVPFIFKRLTGVNNFSPAGAVEDGALSYFQRVLAYFFDPNLGVLSFAPLLELCCLLLFFYSVFIKKYRAISFMACFVGTIMAYSLMTHINCGMLYCARYVYWTYPTLVIFMITIGYECFDKKWIYVIINVLAVTISAGLLKYNTNTYYNSICFNQFSEFILDKIPSVYNPLHSTFYSRVLHVNGGYDYDTPIIYYNADDNVRKILAAEKDAEELLKKSFGTEKDMEWFKQQLDALTEKEMYISVPYKYQISYAEFYELGTDIMFYSEMYNADKYVRKGISKKEENLTWTTGNEMKIQCKIEDQPELIHGLIELADVYNSRQNVTILVNGREVYDEVIENDENIEFSFAGNEGDSYIDIDILLPNAESPSETGDSIDTRKLALAIKRIVLT